LFLHFLLLVLLMLLIVLLELGLVNLLKIDLFLHELLYPDELFQILVTM